MKNIYKYWAGLVLIVLAIILGCTKDVDVDDEFDFTMRVDPNPEGYVYDLSNWGTTVTPERIVLGQTYKWSYTVLEGEGKFEIGSGTEARTLPEGEQAELDQIEEGPSLHFRHSYLPTVVGNHKIEITVENKQGIKHSQIIEYKVEYAPFTFLFVPNANVFLMNAQGPITSTIIKNGSTDEIFKFRYMLSGGDGKLYDGNIEIPHGDIYEVQGGVKNLKYVPSTLGTHNILAQVTAADGSIVTRVVDIIVENVPFTIDATSATTSINLNQDLGISVNLTEGQASVGTTYEIMHSYQAGGGSGTLKDENGNIRTAGVYYPITPGTFPYTFNSTTNGEATINFKVRDSNGQVKEDSITITVSNVAFTFIANPTQNNVNLNQVTTLNFNLTPNSTAPSVTYTLISSLDRGDGTLANVDGSEITPGTPIAVVAGNFQLRYKPNTIGGHGLNFIVRDNYGEERTATIVLNSIHTPVTFNVSSATQTYVNQSVPVNFVITPQANNGITYEMNYVLSGGEGILASGNTEVFPGQYFGVGIGTFSYNFTPQVAGNYTLSFELKDSNGQLITRSITIVVQNNNFVFTPTQSQNVYVNEDNLFSFALVPTGNYSNTSYTVSYTLGSGQLATFKKDETVYQQGAAIPVTPTAFSMKYRPTTVGQHTISYFVTDSNGLRQEVQQNVNVIASDFIFTTQQSNSTIFKNTQDNILLSLSQQQANPNLTYTLAYSINGVGRILEGSNQLPISGTIAPGNRTLKFVSEELGSSVITFTITDSNGTTHSRTVNYNVVNTDFIVSTSGDGSLIVNNSKDFNVYLSQTIADPTTTYEVKYTLASGTTGSGKISQSNVEIPLGTFSSMPIGSSQLSFKGTEPGLVNLLVEVKDSNGLVHSSTVVFNVTAITYAFTGASQNTTLFIGESTNLNFDITETSPSGTNYEIKYVLTQGNAEIKNGSESLNANQWYPANIGNFSRTLNATEGGTVKVTFTARNVLTQVERSQIISISVNQAVFSINATATNNNLTVNSPANVNLNLTQTGAGSMGYTMVFNTSAQGTFTYGGTTYTAGQPIPINVGASFGAYKGSVAGVHNVTFTVTNSNNVSSSSSVAVTYANNDFAISTSGDGSVILNNSKDLNVFLSQIIPDNSIAYQVKYTIASGSTGTGELRQNGTVVPMGAYSSISLGNTALAFKGTGAGRVNLEVTVRDSNNVTHTSTIVIDVNAISYTFTGAPQNNTLILGGSTNLNFDITETSASGTTYEMKYVLTQGNGEIKNGAEALNANQWYPVNVGAFSRLFNATESGTIKATFTVRNTVTLVEKTQILTVNVGQAVFNLAATATNNNLTVNSPANVNLNLTQTGTGTISYSMVFNTSAQGTFTYGGTTYTAGQPIPINVGASFGAYKGSVAGVHNVTFTVTNSNNVSSSSSVAVTYANNDFAISTSGDGSVILNNSKDLNVFLSQIIPDNSIAYQVKYTIASGSTGTGELRQNGTVVPMGAYASISLGNTALSFKGTGAGRVNLEVTVRDSNNVTHTSTIVIDVNAISYTFTGAPQNNTLILGGSTNLNFDITETSASGTTYEMKYVLTQGNGEIKNGAQALNANQWYPVNVGAFSRLFNATESGTIKATFTVRNTVTLVEKTQILTVNVGQAVFNLAATATNNNLTVNSPANVNLNLTQTGTGTTTYSMVFTTSAQGTFTYGGTTYTAGQPIPINVGASFGTYKGSTAGAHNVTFTVSNTSNASVSSSVAITFVNNDFAISTSGDGSVILNNSKDLNVFLSQIIPDNSIAYQVKYAIASGSTGTGELRQNGTVVPMGAYASISLGNTALAFKGTGAGRVNLEVTVRDSNNITHSSIIAIDVNAISYTFTGAPQNNSVYVGSSTNLNFDIVENSPTGTSYEMKFVLTQGNGEFRNGSVAMNTNQWYPVNIGSFARSFTGTEEGTVKATFTVRNTVTQVEKTQIITIAVGQASFNFEAIATASSQTVNSTVTVNFNVSQIGAGTIPYSLVFETSASGTLTVAGQTYSPGQIIAIPAGGSFGTYKGTVAGVHNVTFKVTNPSNIQKIDDVAITFVNNDFSLSTSGDGNLILNNSKDLNVFLSQVVADNSVTYQVKYSIASGSTGAGEIFKQGVLVPMGTYSPISLGNTAVSFKGLSTGTVNLEVSVKDSNNVVHTSIIILSVNEISYTFTGAPQNNSVYLGGSTNLNFDISETSNSDTRYDMKYVITQGNADITNGSIAMNSNEWYPVNVGNFSRIFTATELGAVKITFTVRNRTTLVEKTQVITVNAIQSVFTFSATATSNNQLTGTPVNVNFNLNQVGSGTTNYSLSFTTSSAGTFTYAGREYTAGQQIPFVAGASNGTYRGITGGTHNIVFTATSSSSVSQSAPVGITYLNNDFSLTSVGAGNLYVNNFKDFSLLIAQNTADPSIRYQVRYSIGSNSTGSGQIIAGRNTVNLNTWSEITPGPTTLKFAGTTAGTVNVIAEVKDSNNIVHTTTIFFNVQNIDFTLATSGDGSLLVNSNRLFNTFISQLVTDNSITYQIRFSYATGTTGQGSINQALTAYGLGTFNNIPIGSSEFNFTATSPGLVKLLVEVKDSNNVIKSGIVQFTITQPEYTFTGSPQNNNIYVGGVTNLNFDITEAVATSTRYEMKYSITSGNATIQNGNTALNSNSWYPVSVGGYSWNLTGVQNGEVEVLFTARNTVTNIQKTQVIKIGVNNSNFIFNAASTLNNQIVSTPIPVNFNLTQVGGGSVGYSLKFASSSTGTFVYNGNTYTAGQPIPFVLGASTGNYIGTASGVHNVTFTVTNNNATPVSQSSSVAITYDFPDFTLATSGDGTVVKNDLRNFNIFLSQTSNAPGVTYQVKYSYASGTTGEGQVLDGSVPVALGVFQPISVGNTQRVFKGTNLGTVRILVEVKDSNNITHSSIVVFNVSQIDFSYTATAQLNTIYINNPININQNISENGAGGAAYEVSYVLNNSTGTAKIKKAGIEIEPGVWTSVNSGAFVWTLEGQSIGNMNITLYARNNSGVLKEQSLSIRVNEPTFTVDSTVPNASFTTTNIPIDFVINENGPTSSPYTIRFSNTNSGTMTYDGQTYQPGAVISNVTSLNNRFVYTSSNPGVHDLNFTFTSAYNSTVVKNINFNLLNGDFNYGVSPTSTGSINLGAEVLNNHTLTGITGPTTNYEYSYSVVSGSGTLKQNGISMGANSWHPATEAFTTYFKPSVQGSTVVNYKVRNGFGITKNINVTYNASIPTPNPSLDGKVKWIWVPYPNAAVPNDFNYFYKWKINFDESEFNKVTSVYYEFSIPLQNGSYVEGSWAKQECYWKKISGQVRSNNPRPPVSEILARVRNIKFTIYYQHTPPVILTFTNPTNYIQDSSAEPECN